MNDINKKLISIMVPCYNERENIPEMYKALKSITREEQRYRFEILFEDNASTDGSQDILRELALKDKDFKVIFNCRNFGPQRSSAYCFFQGKGDAVITMACDFQDPPSLIPKFLRAWENGSKVVLGRNPISKDSRLLWWFRNLYYKMVRDYTHDSEMDHVSGFGLYDRHVVDLMIAERNPAPNFRLSIAEYGFTPTFIDYEKPSRRHGVSSYSFKSLFGIAIESLPLITREPIHLIVRIGLGSATIFLLAFLMLLIIGCTTANVTAVIISFIILCCGGISLTVLCMGIIGEYLGLTLAWERQIPLVVERERLNC